MTYTITVIDLDGSRTVRRFDNEDDFVDEYVDYCSLGYDCRQQGNHAVVREVEGV